MAINPSTEYVGKITAPNANYTYGSAKSVTTPTAQDGTPWSIKLVNDIFGFQQAILLAAGIVPSGNSETQLVSQYLQGISEMITNQNYGADAVNTDDYVVTTKSRSSKYEEGLYLLKVTNTNTGAATVNYDSLGVIDIKNPDGSALGAGDLVAGRIIQMIYNGTEMRLVVIGGVVQFQSTQTGAVATGTTLIPNDNSIPQSNEGDEYMTRAFTPKNTANTLIISVVIHFSNSNGNQHLKAALLQDSIANALACGYKLQQSSDTPSKIVFFHVMTAGTTSEIILKVRAGGDKAGTNTFNGISTGRKYGGVMASSLNVIEIGV